MKRDRIDAAFEEENKEKGICPDNERYAGLSGIPSGRCTGDAGEAGPSGGGAPGCAERRCVRNGFALSDEAAFEKRLEKMLMDDARFGNVCTNKQIKMTNGRRMVADLMFSRTFQGKEERFVIEVKRLAATTERAMRAAIQQLRHYRAGCPDVHFILAVPVSVADTYRRQVHAAGFTLWDGDMLSQGLPDVALPRRHEPDVYQRLIDEIRQCRPGHENWQVYQKLVGRILTALFCPPLDAISEQNADADALNRRDFVMPNYAAGGYWPYLRHRYKAEFIVVDAKNAAGSLQKDDVLQVAHYLKEKGAGLFALIFSRSGVDERAERHLRDVWLNEHKMIIVISDSDVEQMLLSRREGCDPCRLLIEKIQEFRLKI